MKIKDLVNRSSEGFEVEVFRSGSVLFLGSILDIGDALLDRDVDTINVGSESGIMYIGV